MFSQVVSQYWIGTWPRAGMWRESLIKAAINIRWLWITSHYLSLSVCLSKSWPVWQWSTTRTTVSFQANLNKAWLQQNDFSPLVTTGESTPGVLGPVLGFPVQERQGHTRESPVKGHKDDEGPGGSLLWRKAEKAGTVQSGEQKAQGHLIKVYKYLKRVCKEDGTGLTSVVNKSLFHSFTHF